MTWLAADPPPRTLDEALALRPDLRAGFGALEAAVEAEPALDGALRARCRARVATLMGAAAAPAPAAGGDDPAIELVEQLVLDPHGVSDALVARVATVLSARAVVALAQAVVVWEGRHRIARALGVAPEP
jgi:hypothetical protein